MKASDLKALGPLAFLIVMSLALHFFGDQLWADKVWPIVERAEHVVAGWGYLGYGMVVAAYVFCCFFFVPLLIPLNVASGALYGPYVGTAVAVASITAGSAASAVSIRHVFTGLRKFLVRRVGADRVLRQIGIHGVLSVLLLRLAFIVPYMWQNILLSLSPIKLRRLVPLTAVGSIPGAAIYSLLGAGLMSQAHSESFGAYLGVPLLLLLVVTIAVKFVKKRYAEEAEHPEHADDISMPDAASQDGEVSK